VHWGTFDLTDESLDQPPKDLALARESKGLTSQDFDMMAIGQTLKLSKRKNYIFDYFFIKENPHEEYFIGYLNINYGK
jgi:hypothetical protein